MDDLDSILYARDFERTNEHIIHDLLQFREKLKKRKSPSSSIEKKDKTFHSEVLMP